MTYRQAATRGLVGGAVLAGCLTLILAARCAYEVTRTHRWYQLKQL